MEDLSKSASLRVAVDIGGTFTDLVSFAPEDGRITYNKSLTTYDTLARGVLDCMKIDSVDARDVTQFVHGSTIAINAVIQRKGALTGLITTAGFRDVYAIGRGSRPAAYNLLFQKLKPLVSRAMTFEVDERLNARGDIVRPLDEQTVKSAIQKLLQLGVESVAVVLLHSYRNPVHEVRVRDMIRNMTPSFYVTVSHEILREFREYERTSTSVLNSYVAPIVSNYVTDLKNKISGSGFDGAFLIMQSNGGTMSADVATTRPVAMMESGPVAGVIASGRLGEALGLSNVISFDMGGTTAKASLIENGNPRIVTGYQIGGHNVGHPMMLPVVDIVEVGTGGGSIAWIDQGGGLRVGPISAGSAPGPVCYGRGGQEPTITDANLVLGRINAENFLGGQMSLDLAAARKAIEETIAKPLGMTVNEAALGVLKIADARMSLAVREVSVAKGHDPRDFALVASGGAGPLHAANIARELSIPTVVVPELPGTFSALGMLMTDIRHDVVRTYIAPLEDGDIGLLQAAFVDMEKEVLAILAKDGVPSEAAVTQRSLDLRYLGQEFTLNVPLSSAPVLPATLAAARKQYDELHETQYSHSARGERVEVVNVRLAAFAATSSQLGKFERITVDSPKGLAPKVTRTVVFDSGPADCPVYERSKIPSGALIKGPALIEERVSTTVICPNDSATLSSLGPILINVGAM